MYSSTFIQQTKNVRKHTNSKFRKLLNDARRIRNYTEDCIYKITGIVHKTMNKYDYYLYVLFVRIIKTSQVISELNKCGNYVEAQALLRINYEKVLLIKDFVIDPALIKEWFELKKRDRKKFKSRFSIYEITKRIKANYSDYEELCKYVHPNWFMEDISIRKDFVEICRWPSYDEQTFGISESANANIVLEAFKALYLYFQTCLVEVRIMPALARSIRKTENLHPIEIILKNYITEQLTSLRKRPEHNQ